MITVDAQPRLKVRFVGEHPPKRSMIGCENGRHSAIGSSKVTRSGIVHAECRHCGCELMRLGASRRWFRCGQMGG